MRRAHVIAGIVVPLLTLSAAFAEAPASRWFPVPANALYLTGDSWSDTGVTYRLYGVQSCLRGTSFTNAHGLERDCGEASLAMLVALTRDLRPQCYDAAEQPETKTVFVFCVATRVAGAGRRIADRSRHGLDRDRIRFRRLEAGRSARPRPVLRRCSLLRSAPRRACGRFLTCPTRTRSSCARFTNRRARLRRRIHQLPQNPASNEGDKP